ncbi:hypothetical protein ADK75_18575 [Streptomyces virginiae]|uniref:histidine kinase n=1 Tax=Streptomyces virginiae TaxID=1961 RepID=A0A0L8MIE3_STRVG|nr:histidine kinase [Streptomyces virginiae]KOG50169.1 hypothetical protein ADK75_18575 [Streptomyces virginiae]
MHAGFGLLDRLGGRRPLVVDSLLALGYVGAGLLLGQEQPPAGWRSMDMTGAVLTALVGLVLLARRIAPVEVFAASSTLWVVFIACGYWPVVNSMPPLLGLYTVAATRRRRTSFLCTGVVTGIWVYAGIGNIDNSSMPTVIAQAVLFPAVVLVVGRGSGALAERNRQFAELTLRLREQQEENALRALTEERVRIARELHDVVAHHMSVVALQAGMASYVFPTDPAAGRRALETIAETSREALEEMRRMLILLRVGQEGQGDAPAAAPDGGHDTDGGQDTGGAAYAPAPGLDLLDRLLERVRGAGVEVTMDVAGPPARLPQGMALCVYRVVQEALTNVLKHAGPTRASVAIHYAPHGLEVCVTNEQGAESAPDKGLSPGLGLIGMRERAKIYGGSVTAGPRARGGFEVRLTLPAPTTV